MVIKNNDKILKAASSVVVCRESTSTNPASILGASYVRHGVVGVTLRPDLISPIID